MLKRLFLEARWFYNDLLARGDVFHADYMTKTVQVFDKEGKVESPPLRYLSAQIRQEILDRTKDSILGLARLRRSG
ncbi:MAG: hypothetical protein JRN06_08145 [Nitrososphaerota archaeon]|nr:hypothetical protein [Nitrososphaerota archaeon]MDG7024247.1 hypothetical protein [Nitrososphaerota archaeon]